MTPILITAHMIGNGEYAEHTPDIASLLEYQWLDQRNLLQSNPTPDSVITPDLPIAKLSIEDYWQWAATSPIYTYSIEQTDFMTRRWSMGMEYPVQWGKQTQKVQTDGGSYKSWRKPVFIRNPAAIHWYTMGDIDQVRSLLEPVTALGGKRGQGFGQVNHWDIQECESDRTLTFNGRLMSPVPVRFVEALGIILNGNSIRRWSVQAPRWHSQTTELFAMPNLVARN